jgi:hypothetical protein
MFSGVVSEGSLPEGFLFCGRRCFSEVSHPQKYSIVTRDTVIPMNIEVPTKYLPSYNDRIVVFEIRLHSESPMLYRPAISMATEMLCVLLEGRSKKNSPSQRFHTQLCCQIVRYFCQACMMFAVLQCTCNFISH